MSKIPLIVVDTETSGVDFLSSQVIQCCAIVIDENLKSTAEGSWNVNYDESKFAWSEESASIHKIDKQTALTHGLESLDFIEKLNEFIREHYTQEDWGSIRIVAANSYFDFVMLKHLYIRHGKGDDFPFGYHTIDLNTLGTILFDAFSFSSLCRILGVKVSEEMKHSATYDTYLHLAAFQEINRRMKNSVY